MSGKRLVLSKRKYQELKQYVYERDNYSCVNCGTTEMPSLQHVKRRSQGGDDSPRNTVTMCIPCHDAMDQYKIDMPESVYLMLENEPWRL